MAVREIYGQDKVARTIQGAFNLLLSAAITSPTSSNNASA
jgi:hypothetical protein